MKARIRKTGEIVDVYHETQHSTPKMIYKESVLVNSRMWAEDELELLTNNEEDAYWQDVRERAAIAAMQGTITILGSNDRSAFREIVVEGFSRDKKTYPNEIAEFAVACADELIKLLKEQNNEKN